MPTAPPPPAARPRCSVYIAVSVDGFIARPDGALDWLARVARPGEDYGYQAFADTVDALVMGRNTYDVAAGFTPWPYAGKRVVVLTHHAPAARHGEEFCAEAPAALVARLGQDGVRRVYVDGGAVIRQFLAARLIDDLTLSIIPVLLGSGLPLFATGGPEQGLELDTVRSWPTGLTQLRYRAVPG